MVVFAVSQIERSVWLRTIAEKMPLSDAIPVISPDAASAAKLFEDIAEKPRGLFFSDEFFQFFII